MIKFLSLLMVFHTFNLYSQSILLYGKSNANAHNDYLQDEPFWGAYKQGFGSIETDVILKDGILYAAGQENEIVRNKTLKSTYINPLVSILKKNNGHVFPIPVGKLQIIINLKSPFNTTLAALIKELQPLEKYLKPEGNLAVIVSGDSLDPNKFEIYPTFIFFEGRPDISYSAYQLSRIGLISENFKNYSQWNGEGDMLKRDRRRLEKVISKTHYLGKKIRFWGVPDNINSWKEMMKLKVDYLNTDKVTQMGDYLRTAPK